ncbi:putative ribonuclease H protein [Citrus sinensis]|nr:putative ribonuclease H protein [Citrus sinensis]
MWSLAWSWKGPQSVRLFLWQIMHGSLKTHGELVRRHIPVSMACDRCGAPVEDILHALRDCPCIKRVWLCLVSEGDYNFFFHDNLRDWIVANLQNKSKPASHIPWECVFGVAVWRLWFWRNHFMVEGKLVDSSAIIMDVMARVNEIHRINFSHMSQQPRRRRDFCRLAGAGGVIRDYAGNWISGFCMNIGECTLVMAELWGLYQGLLLAWEAGIKWLLVEVDSLCVTQMISKQVVVPNVSYALVVAVRDLLNRNWQVCLTHIYREANSVADFMANMALSLPNTKLGFPSGENSSLPVAIFNGPEPFRGKSGSVSFCGLTHQLVEEGKLMSAPFQEDKGSFLWILAPVVLISSLILPQMFLGNVIEDFIKDNLLMEIVSSLTFESMFYVGLAIFLRITDRVQRPYLQFSPKRWGLITGLRGYLTSAFFTTGLKVVAPLFAVYVTWPVLRLPALVAVLPFLVGCAAQLAFETNLDKRGSSCWPLIPIIFEVYRLYQLSKAANFIERLMFSMKDLPRSPELLERGSAMVSMVVIFQILGVVCLWSLLTFLLRLFPSRPVAENY